MSKVEGTTVQGTVLRAFQANCAKNQAETIKYKGRKAAPKEQAANVDKFQHGISKSSLKVWTPRQLAQPLLQLTRKLQHLKSGKTKT